MGEILKRHGGFSIRWYEGGRRRVLATKQPSHALAKRMLVEIEARVARGEAGIPERCTATWPTVAELVDRFCSEYTRPKIKDVELYRAHARSKLQKFLPHLGKLTTGQVDPADVAKARDALLKTHAPGTVIVGLAVLSAAFSWAARAGLAPANPCKGVERPRAPHSLDFLTQDEASKLLDGAAAQATTLLGRMLHVGIALALYCGLRRGELLGLRWIDLDMRTRRLTVARSYRGTTKSGRVRHLRLPAAVVPLLESWRPHCPESPQGLVLPVGHNRLRGGGADSMLGLPRLMSHLGLRKVARPWHLLRHTFASHYMMLGGNILALQKILGHTDLKVTMIYAHLAPDFLGEEMDRVRF